LNIKTTRSKHMAAKDVKFNTDARDRMLRGVNVCSPTR
jgi:hypothetical protein